MPELPYEQCDLPAMISGMVESVLYEFAQRIDGVIERPRGIELGLCQTKHVGLIRFLVAGPRAAETRGVMFLIGIRLGNKVANLPESKPSLARPREDEPVSL